MICRARALQSRAEVRGDVLLRMRHTHKMAPETLVDLSFSLFDSLAEFICSKGSSSVGYRVDWCKNNRLQSNQFVGRRDEEEKEKHGENRG